jgi:hypothetical protein
MPPSHPEHDEFRETHDIEVEAADRIDQLERELAATEAARDQWMRQYEEASARSSTAPILEEALRRCSQHHLDDAMLDSPCIFCGYNGAGYWQSGTHAEHCRWHTVGGYDDRHKSLHGGSVDGTANKP